MLCIWVDRQAVIDGGVAKKLASITSAEHHLKGVETTEIHLQ